MPGTGLQRALHVQDRPIRGRAEPQNQPQATRGLTLRLDAVKPSYTPSEARDGQEQREGREGREGITKARLPTA